MQAKCRTCAGWDNNTHPAFIWSSIDGRKYCKNCFLRLKKPTIKKISDKQKIKNQENSKHTFLLHRIMYDWWNSFGILKYCECCNKRLPTMFSTINVHHLLPKAKYKEEALNIDYFMLLCADCHSSWEIMPKNEIIKKRTEEAKIKFNK